MPLDARKAQHIQAVIPKTFAQRQKTVVFVSQNGAVYSYTALSVIFRPQTQLDPQIPDQHGSPPRQQHDTILVAPIGTNFSGVVYIADTTTATAPGVSAAAKYELISVVPIGIVAGGNRILAYLRRFR